MESTTKDEAAKLEAERKRRAEYMRKYLTQRYATDPAFREKQKARSKVRFSKLRADPAWRAKENAKRLEKFKVRYASDPDYRAKLSERGRAARKRAGPNWRRSYRLFKDYGLSLEAFDAMHQAQGGGCAICTRISDEWLHVDHEHVDGYEDMRAEQKASYVRGLLCKDCNSGLGRFGDDAAQ